MQTLVICKFGPTDSTAMKNGYRLNVHVSKNFSTRPSCRHRQISPFPSLGLDSGITAESRRCPTRCDAPSARPRADSISRAARSCRPCLRRRSSNSNGPMRRSADKCTSPSITFASLIWTSVSVQPRQHLYFDFLGGKTDGKTGQMAGDGIGLGLAYCLAAPTFDVEILQQW